MQTSMDNGTKMAAPLAVICPPARLLSLLGCRCSSAALVRLFYSSHQICLLNISGFLL